MFRKLTVLAAAFAVAACAPSRPATPPAGVQPGATAERVQPPPVHALLGYREQLELDSEQIAALDSIGQWLFASGDQLRTQMREAQAAAAGRRSPASTEEALAALTGLRDRNRQATEGVQEVLTEEQQEKVCEIFEQNRSRSVPQRAAPNRNRRGVVAPGEPPPVWGWCASPTRDDGATAREG